MAAQADKLTEGTKELLKRYPTMRVDVYPTHRTVAFPQRVLDNTLKNATGAKTVDGGVALENVLPGYPFPIPKTGSEAIWNHLLRYNGLGYDGPRYENWNVDAAGVPTLAVAADAYWAWPIYDPKKTGTINGNEPYWYNKLLYVGPARRNGEALLIIDAVNPLKQPRRAWQYLPGQRRVQARARSRLRHAEPRRRRRGNLRRRVGVQRRDRPLRLEARRQEGDVRSLQQLPADVPQDGGRHHQAATTSIPDLVRWELHRVWVVEATLKPGKRHIYSKRMFYLDEDSWTALASDQYDARGQLYRSSFAYQSYSYDVQAPFGDTFAIYDFSSGVYNITRPVRPVQRAQVHDRAAARQRLVAGSAGRRGRCAELRTSLTAELPVRRARRVAPDATNADYSNHDRLRDAVVSTLGARRSRCRSRPRRGRRLRRRARHAGADLAAREQEPAAGGDDAPATALVAVGQRGHIVVSTDGGATLEAGAGAGQLRPDRGVLRRRQERLGGRPRRRRSCTRRRRRHLARCSSTAARPTSCSSRRWSARSRPSRRRSDAKKLLAEAKRYQEQGAGQAVPRRLVRRCAATATWSARTT